MIELAQSVRTPSELVRKYELAAECACTLYGKAIAIGATRVPPAGWPAMSAAAVAFAGRSCSGGALPQCRHSLVAQPRAAEDIQCAAHGKI